MKELPEIAPELRGLLEEIVADPRSAIRLVPRRALRSWFDSGESARARHVSATRAERHLIDAHREALAHLLREAAIIAYWKAPVLSLRPRTGDALRDLVQGEPGWRHRAGRMSSTGLGHAGDVAILRECLEGIRPEHGRTLAAASLNLVPRDEARLCLACHVPSTRPRWAQFLFQRVATQACSDQIRGLAWAGAAKQLVMLNRIDEAWQAYVKSRSHWPDAWFSLFNLACVTGNQAAASECSSELGRLAAPESPVVSEVCTVLRGWLSTRTQEDVQRARDLSARLGDRLSATARRVSLVYE